MDRNGVALGSVHIGGGAGAASAGGAATDTGDYETRLLSRGLAKLDRRRAEQQLPGSDLGLKFKAWGEVEQLARDRRLGLWADEATVAEYEREAAAGAAAGDDETVTGAARGAGASGPGLEPKAWRAKLAEIVDGATCFVHNLDAKLPGAAPSTDAATLFDAVTAKMQRAFAASSSKATTPDAKTYRRGAVVAASFDGDWCRAKILETSGPFDPARAASFSVTLRYVDYGNVEAGVPAARLRPLDPVLAALPAAAVEAELAYVKVAAVDDDAGEAAARAVHDLAWDRTLSVEQHADFRPGSDNAHKKRVVLRVAKPHAAEQTGDAADETKDDAAQSINERLVELGLARVPRAAKRDAARTAGGPELVAALAKLEQQARASRLGLWRYGDVDYSDDEN